MINIRKTPTRHGNIYGVAQYKGRTFKFCTCMHLTGPFTEHIEIFLTIGDDAMNTKKTQQRSANKASRSTNWRQQHVKNGTGGNISVFLTGQAWDDYCKALDRAPGKSKIQKIEAILKSYIQRTE